MFFNDKIWLLTIILSITENIFALNFMVQKYLIFNKQKFATNHLNIVKSLISPDLLTCLMACSDRSNCNAVAKKMNICWLISILNDANLIQDDQVNLYLKQDNSKFSLVRNQLSKIYLILNKPLKLK